MAKKTHSDADTQTVIDGPAICNGPASAAKPKLTKRERFLKYAPKRTNRLIKAVNALANCFSEGGYEWEVSEAEKIADAAKAANGRLLERIAGVKRGKYEFTL